MRYVDTKKREEEILNFVVDSYIEESKPISSSYLCRKYPIKYSPATVRGVLESLEKQGYLSHIYTSSGRVPTKKAFKHYVANIKSKQLWKKNKSKQGFFLIESISDINEVINKTLDTLSLMTGYTSLVGLWGKQEGFYYRGVRFIFQHPEFEDIDTIRNLFCALEIKIEKLQQILFDWVDNELTILIGDEIGFREISECSLLIAGLHKESISLALGLLGPIRMHYLSAISSLYSVKINLEENLKMLL